MVLGVCVCVTCVSELMSYWLFVEYHISSLSLSLSLSLKLYSLDYSVGIIGVLDLEIIYSPGGLFGNTYPCLLSESALIECKYIQTMVR